MNIANEQGVSMLKNGPNKLNKQQNGKPTVRTQSCFVVPCGFRLSELGLAEIPKPRVKNTHHALPSLFFVLSGGR